MLSPDATDRTARPFPRRRDPHDPPDAGRPAGHRGAEPSAQLPRARPPHLPHRRDLPGGWHGATLTSETSAAATRTIMQTTADIVAYGTDVRQRLTAWWAAKPDKSGREMVQTYYGPQTLHEYLERTPGIRPACAPVGHAARHGRHRGGPSAARGRFRQSADAKPGVGRVTRDKRAAGPVAPRSAARPQAAAGPVPAHAARRLEFVEGTALHIMDLRLHHSLCNDGRSTRLRPGIRPRAMARQRRLRRRDALSRARGRSDHRECSAHLADEIDRADQYRPRPLRMASFASAKFGAAMDHISGGRWGINVVTGYKPSDTACLGWSRSSTISAT